ncbi:urease accessory protein UreD [Alcaligenaceae bacterium]|nr:urease accessory protein UreD [Alcaligenaceae bacterium]
MPDTLSDWHARLELVFSRQGRSKTVLAHNRHEGPLLVQKALYPEGPAICHVTLLHPPSGIAGGDSLSMDITLNEGSHAVLSTPGASRWYKSLGRPSAQALHIRLAANSRLDWLPQENIFFEQAHASSLTRLHLQSGACAIGWEITQLGGIDKAGHWNEGQVLLDTQLTLDGRLMWLDAGELQAKCPLRHSNNGLAGFPVMATLWAFGPQVSTGHMESLETGLPWSDTLRAGITHLPQKQGQSLSLLRVLGTHTQDVRQLLIAFWMRLRPVVLGTQGTYLRLWNT